MAKKGSAAFDFPEVLRPTPLLRLPREYTQLHSEVKLLAPLIEYPAICMVCGLILDAGGGGQVTRHCKACSADSGVAFLLLESAVLLLHGDRASYFPSPYVDEHGERAKTSRGKPILWDERRGALLDKLYAEHDLAREIMLKRSSSQRVVIANHY
jgi:Proteolysis_6 C-terminal